MNLGRSRSGVSYVRHQEERVLQSLVGLLWATVARVADGYEIDSEDQNTIARAQYALRGQKQMSDFVHSRAAAGRLTATRGTDTFVDLLDVASKMLGAGSPLGADSVELIDELIEALEQVAEGNREVAERYVDLFGLVAGMVESASPSANLY